MSFYGLLNLPWWGYVIFTLVMTHITMAGVTIFLHRCQAHRGLELHPIMSHFFRFWLYLTTGMKTKEWVAVHRKHHAFSEQAEDPHSPHVYGIGTLLLEGADLYRAAKKDTDLLDKYGKHTPDDWMERHVYSTRFLKGKLGVILMLLIDVILLGGPGIIVWAIQMAWTPFFAAGVINGLAHFWGYRNFECPDMATNIIPWGILIGGEELHNNHHTYGTSAKFSVKKWEFDVGWMYIQLMSAVGLAKVKRVFPRAVIDSAKPDVDIETVKAIVSNRLQVLSQYSKRVISPVFRSERRQSGGKLTHRQGRLLLRNKAIINAGQQAQIDTALQANQTLSTVCQFRDRLQAIWTQTTASQKELLAALQEWCQQAEQSGVKSLQDFAGYVRGYVVVRAAA